MTWDALIVDSGLAAWFLLCAEIIVGVTLQSGTARYALNHRRKNGLHRAISWLLLAVFGIHIETIVDSNYLGWGLNMVTVMGFGTLARETGVAAAWALVIVVVAGWAKPHIPRTLWTVSHRYGTFTVLVLATIHGVYAGMGLHSLRIIVPGVATLTFVASIFIARWYAAFARTTKRRTSLKK